jgi:hypothetical protein
MSTTPEWDSESHGDDLLKFPPAKDKDARIKNLEGLLKTCLTRLQDECGECGSHDACTQVAEPQCETAELIITIQYALKEGCAPTRPIEEFEHSADAAHGKVNQDTGGDLAI